MLENEGHWLKLMRNAILPTDANICLRISGGDILCTVTKDVNKEVELKVTCRVVDHMSEEVDEGILNTDEDREEMASNRSSSIEQESDSEVRSETDYQESMDCSSKRKEKMKLRDSEENCSKRRKVSLSPNQRQPEEEPVVYKCPLCSFLVEDHRTFEKHLQTHRSSSFKRVSSNMTNAQSFCDACNIQFMSVDTYQVHRKYYCKSRHDKEDSSPLAPEAIPGAFKPSPDTVILRNGMSSTPSLIQPQAIYAAISTNPLILLPCSLVNGEGLVAQNGASGIVLQTSYPAIVRKPSLKKEETLPNRKTSHPAMNFNGRTSEGEQISPLRKRKMSEGDVLNMKKSLKLSEDGVTLPVDPDTPLDLSLKRTSDVSYKKPSNVENKESSGESSPRSAGVIVKSPSSSYSDDSVHCYSSQEAVSLLKQPHHERISPSPPVLQADEKSTVLPPGMPPPKVLKQGNNICEECNIVFYKYDNYMAHKKHYCAYRRQQLSALAAAAASSSSAHEHSSDDNNSNHSHEVYSADENSKRRMDSMEPFRLAINKPSHSAFVCDACGVKFSSLDTLNAHQTYYCSKREDSVMSKYVKSRNENSGSLEPPFSGPEEWKCNYCETTCSSYEAIRRHLLTHSELRGFRCLLCGYKGNTLRGMRAHACEHLSESTTSIEEFMASIVISENDALPISRVEMSDDDSEASRDQHNSKRELSERSRDESESRDCQEMANSSPNETQLKESTHVKVEVCDSSPEVNERVNPLAFCDVVIKTENEHSSSGDESREEHTKNRIKSEPERDSDVDSSSLEHSESPPVQPISVIRCGPDKERRGSDFQSENNTLPHTKPKKLKHCKTCDISFYHLSNYVAHKKYYCSVPNCIQEATTVQ